MTGILIEQPLTDGFEWIWQEDYAPRKGFYYAEFHGFRIFQYDMVIDGWDEERFMSDGRKAFAEKFKSLLTSES